MRYCRAGVEIAGAVLTGLGLIKGAFEVLQGIQTKLVEMAEEPDKVKQLKLDIAVVQKDVDLLINRRLQKDSAQLVVTNLRKFLVDTAAGLQTYTGPSFWELVKRVFWISPWPSFLAGSFRNVARFEALMKDVQAQDNVSDRVSLPGRYVQPAAYDVAKAALLATSSDLQRPRGVPQVLLLTGMYGMGKSTLALKLALDLEKSSEF